MNFRVAWKVNNVLARRPSAKQESADSIPLQLPTRMSVHYLCTVIEGWNTELLDTSLCYKTQVKIVNKSIGNKIRSALCAGKAL
jgi:hypothetical protein